MPRTEGAAPPRDLSSLRVRTDGKFFSLGGEQFRFHGVTYGTFHSRDDGALFPQRERIAEDFRAMADAGFTVVRTYTPPPDDLLELAAECGLRVFARDLLLRLALHAGRLARRSAGASRARRARPSRARRTGSPAIQR